MGISDIPGDYIRVTNSGATQNGEFKLESRYGGGSIQGPYVGDYTSEYIWKIIRSISQTAEVFKDGGSVATFNSTYTSPNPLFIYFKVKTLENSAHSLDIDYSKFYAKIDG